MVMEGMIEVFGLMLAKILRKEFFLSYKTNRQKQELKKSTCLYICMTMQARFKHFHFSHPPKKKGEIHYSNSLPHLRNTKPFYIMEQRVN